MPKLRDISPPPAYSEAAPLSTPYSDEEAGFEMREYNVLELDSRDTIRPRSSFVTRWFQCSGRQLCFWYLLLAVIIVTPGVIVIIAVANYQF
ncbi:hypothetical protein BDV25DRAFT_152358 [Aspergillus avenaceus]|uniref:Uncharacterized protein n=1 Tax=Aspergillus avenaceus TaxID=36643 RepID=A0A5N6TZ78_ASPAV|nr:hypothetical protein BDV25DRAFT_152358 [Aspergillus avenaceus]